MPEEIKDDKTSTTGGTTKDAKQLSDSEKKLVELEAEKQSLVAEARGLREKGREKDTKLKEAEDRLAEIEAAKLKEQGHYKKLYEETLTKLGEVSTSAKRKLIRAELRAAVTEAGATDTDVARLIDTDDLLLVDDDEDLSEAIKDKVARHKELKPTFYKAPASNDDASGAAGDDRGTRTLFTGSRRPTLQPAGKEPKLDARSLPKKDYEEAKRAHLKELRNQQPRRY